MAGADRPQKRALRAAIRADRRALGDAAVAAADLAIGARLEALASGLGARRVACYLSTGTEPGTASFRSGAATLGLAVLMPIPHADRSMSWVVDGGGMRMGVLGVPEPTGGVGQRGALQTVDLIVVPAAAVDFRGTRLGWGLGYYDRALAALAPRPPVYAVIFDHELVDEVPRERHDRTVDGVVTPTRTVEFTAVPPRADRSR